MAANRMHGNAWHFPAVTRGVLVVASASQDGRATARLVAAMHARESVRVHVAAVRGRPSGYAASFLRRIAVRKALEDLARASAASLCAELDALGVPYRTHVEIGPWLATIGRLARDLGCARVLVGADPNRAMHDATLRLDQWLIRNALRRQGHACAVVRGDEASPRADRGLGAGSAPHLP